MMLSGNATGWAGQLNVKPPAVTWPPGFTPAASSPCSEKLKPPPSKSAWLGLASSEMPALLLYQNTVFGCATVNDSVAVGSALPSGAVSATGTW